MQKSAKHNRDLLENNRKLHKMYLGERCFIVGNGSSINKMNLTRLSNEYVFVMNDFIKHPDVSSIAPTFCSFIEPISISYSFSKTNPYYPDIFLPKLDYALRDLKTTLFFEIEYKPTIDKLDLFNGMDVHFLSMSNSLSSFITRGGKLEDNISKQYSFGDASVYSAICCCAYMGFKDIYLIGFDHDYIITKTDTHFYSQNVLGRNFENNTELALNLYTYLRKMAIVKEHFQAKGVNIFNAGIGGMLDVFKRVKYESLF